MCRWVSVLLVSVLGVAGCPEWDQAEVRVDALLGELAQDPCCALDAGADRGRCARLLQEREEIRRWNSTRFDDRWYALSFEFTRAVGVAAYSDPEALAEKLRCVDRPPAPLSREEPAPPPVLPESLGCTPARSLHMEPTCMALCHPSCAVERWGGVPQVLCRPEGLSWSGANQPPWDFHAFTPGDPRHRTYPNGFSSLSQDMKQRLLDLDVCLEFCCAKVADVPSTAPVPDSSYAAALRTDRLLFPALPHAKDAVVFEGSLHQDGQVTRLTHLRFTTTAGLAAVMKFYEKHLRRRGVPRYRCSLHQTCGLGPGEDRLECAEIRQDRNGSRMVTHPLRCSVSATRTGDITAVWAVWATDALGAWPSR